MNVSIYQYIYLYKYVYVTLQSQPYYIKGIMQCTQNEDAFAGHPSFEISHNIRVTFPYHTMPLKRFYAYFRSLKRYMRTVFILNSTCMQEREKYKDGNRTGRNTSCLTEIHCLILRVELLTAGVRSQTWIILWSLSLLLLTLSRMDNNRIYTTVWWNSAYHQGSRHSYHRFRNPSECEDVA